MLQSSTYVAGNGKNYLNLSLQDGKVALTINLGSGRLDTGIKPRDIKFNDDKWHHVLIVRAAKEVGGATIAKCQ